MSTFIAYYGLIAVTYYPLGIRRLKMKFSENSTQAVDYLRQAVPTMMKYSIVPNPLNYTLWYSYFSKAFPELNKELDQTVERYGTCPANLGESLFLQHISNIDTGSEEQLITFQKTFSHLVNNLSDSLDTTAKQTNCHSQALMGNVVSLESFDIAENITSVITELSTNANAIYEANKDFHEQLSAAQAEINALKAELENSKREANTDPLTGLYNRRVLESIYHDFVEQKNSNNNLTLIIMDIDKFKTFNDTHGHLLGDQILKIVANILKNECLKPVIPVRFGGEEFALLCPSYDLQQAHILAEGIREKLATTPYNNKRTGNKIEPVTASFGVAQKDQQDDLSSIIEKADKALYSAKEGGRNQVRLAS